MIALWRTLQRGCPLGPANFSSPCAELSAEADSSTLKRAPQGGGPTN